MPISLFKYVLLLMSALAMGSAWANFKDPLDLPAEINPELALSSRLMAVSQAGDRLVVVGPRGHILLSDDQGRNWRQVEVPVSSDLVAVQFPSSELGWAVGHDGVLLHSYDGGQTWTKQLDGFQAAQIAQKHIKDLAEAGDEGAKALLEDVAYLVEDGADKPFLDVLFLNEREGFIVGAYGLAFHTQDGGRTWIPLLGRIDNPGSYHIYALAQVGETVYAAGEQGLLLRWDAEHASFVAIDSPYHGSYFGLQAVGSSLVAYGMRGHAYITHDHGASWVELVSESEDSITGSTSLGEERFVLATQGGKLLLGTIESAQLVEIPVQSPMPFYGVAAASLEEVALVGARGVYVQSIKPER